jgi:hypothetical protein
MELDPLISNKKNRMYKTSSLGEMIYFNIEKETQVNKTTGFRLKSKI